MNIISEETKDGYKYKTYDNGTVIKQLATAIENVPVEPEPLSDQEQAVLDTAINTDYLVCLADLGL